MENEKKKNIFSRIISFVWERINQVDVPDGIENLSKDEISEVKKVREVQAGLDKRDARKKLRDQYSIVVDEGDKDIERMLREQINEGRGKTKQVEDKTH